MTKLKPKKNQKNQNTKQINEARVKEIGKSPNSSETRKAELISLIRQTVPEVMSDNLIDLDKLKEVLGHEKIADPKDHYELNWAGKSAARREIQKSSTHTLLPDPKNPHNAKHMLIEGENLEVLRVLQKSYHGKVKMIYIDPPYNSGNDSFVYPDDFSEDQQDYLKRVGEISSDGYLNKQSLWKKNSKENGRFHSVWLSMMYPRLFLAKNLLKSDGVIFISIDDNELSNLKLLCDEIFGVENFRNCFITRRYDKNLNRQFIRSGLKSLNIGFEYILVYAKSSKFVFHPVFKTASKEREKNGYWKGFWNSTDRPTMQYELLGVKPKTGQWKWSKELADEGVENYKVFQEKFASSMSLEEYWDLTGRSLKFIRKNLLGKGMNKGVEHWIEPSDGVLRNTNFLDLLASVGTPEIRGIFDFPKNVELISTLIQLGVGKNDICLDFFAGSGTTAHAVIELNLEDSGNRQSISVQIPEKLEKDSAAKLAGFSTIADITRSRLNSVISRIHFTHRESTSENSCAYFTLAPSNFKVWRSDVNNVQSLSDQMKLFQSAEKQGGELKAEMQTAMLTELLLKHGLGVLGVHAISKPKKIAGVTVHRVLMPDDRHMWLCFEPYKEALKNQIVQEKPAHVVMLNSCFAGKNADEKLANLQLELAGVDIMLTII